MRSTNNMKKFTIQDGIKIAAAIGAVLVLVVGVSAAAENLGKRRREPVELNPSGTTPAVITEDIVATEPTEPTEPATEPTPVTTPDVTLDATPEVTTVPTAEEDPVLAPESVAENKPATKKKPATIPASVTEKQDTNTVATDEDDESEEADDNRPLSEMKYNPNIKNIVFLGTDRNDVGEQQYYQYGGQSDTILIYSFDMKKKEYFVVVVNRNLVAQVQKFDLYGASQGTEEMQICLAHAYGDGSNVSAYNTILSLNDLLGSDIKYLGFIEMPAANIGAANDLFGGVTVTIEDDFSGHFNDNSGAYRSVNSVDFAIGNTLTLKGDQAHAYLRARMKIKNDPTNNNRMKRQKTYLTALRNKIKTEFTAKQLIKIYDDMLDLIMTNMSKKEITKWILEVYDYKFKGFYDLKGVEGPNIRGAGAYYPVQEETDAIKRLYYK